MGALFLGYFGVGFLLAFVATKVANLGFNDLPLLKYVPNKVHQTILFVFFWLPLILLT